MLALSRFLGPFQPDSRPCPFRSHVGSAHCRRVSSSTAHFGPRLSLHKKKPKSSASPAASCRVASFCLFVTRDERRWPYPGARLTGKQNKPRFAFELASDPHPSCCLPLHVLFAQDLKPQSRPLHVLSTTNSAASILAHTSSLHRDLVLPRKALALGRHVYRTSAAASEQLPFSLTATRLPPLTSTTLTRVSATPVKPLHEFAGRLRSSNLVTTPARFLSKTP